MKWSTFASAVVALAVVASAQAQQQPRPGGGLDTAKIEQLTGAKGKLDEKSGPCEVVRPRRRATRCVAATHRPVPSLPPFPPTYRRLPTCR